VIYGGIDTLVHVGCRTT